MAKEISIFDECLTEEDREAHVRVVIKALGYEIEGAGMKEEIKKISKDPEKYREFCKKIEESNSIFDV